MNTTAERWLPVVGWESLYEISDHGSVRSLDRVVPHINGSSRRLLGRLLHPAANATGHLYVHLWRDGSSTKAYLHRMVLEAFVGPPPDGTEACHRDDVPANNHVSNLRWDTHRANLREASRNGRNPFANKTHCKRGHEFTIQNLIKNPHGHRICKACRKSRREEAA